MSKNTKIIIGILIIIVVALVITLNRSKKPAPATADATQQQTAAAEVQKMLEEVGKHIVLPTDEVPTAAVVSDLSKLKGQPFFERAALGDVVLVYANAKRVILWRPSAQKIVEVSAINFPTATAGTEVKR